MTNELATVTDFLTPCMRQDVEIADSIMGRSTVGRKFNVAEIQQIKLFAEMSIPKPPPAENAEIIGCVKTVAAALPAKKVDSESGRIKVAAYVWALQGFPLPAIQHACNHVLRTCEWFPAPKVFIDLAREWKNPIFERQKVAKAVLLRHREIEPGIEWEPSQCDPNALNLELQALGKTAGYLAEVNGALQWT